MERLERAGKASGLLRALSYEDPVTDRQGTTVDLGTPVRAQAAAALARTDSPLAFEGLMRALDDPDEEVRIAAVRGLRERGGPAAIEPLITVAAHWSDSERTGSRAEAVDALAANGDARVPPAVAAELLSRPHELEPSDCEMAARLARARGEDVVQTTISDLVMHLREASAPPRARMLLVALAPESVDQLIAALDDERTRHEAALALGATHTSRAVDRLSALMLSDPVPAIRRAAAWALGQIRDPAAVEALLLASRDEEFSVRSEAIDSFDKLGNAAVALAVGALMGPMLEEGAAGPDASLTAAANEDEAVAPVEQPTAEQPTAEQQIQDPVEVVPAAENGAGPPAPEPARDATRVSPGVPSPRPSRPGSRAAPMLRRLLDRYTGE